MSGHCDGVQKDGLTCNTILQKSDNFCRVCGKRVDKSKFEIFVDKSLLQTGSDSKFSVNNNEKLIGCAENKSDDLQTYSNEDVENDIARKMYYIEIGSDDATNSDHVNVGSDDAAIRDTIDFGSDAARSNDTSRAVPTRPVSNEVFCYYCRKPGHLKRNCLYNTDSSDESDTSYRSNDCRSDDCRSDDYRSNDKSRAVPTRPVSNEEVCSYGHLKRNCLYSTYISDESDTSE